MGTWDATLLGNDTSAQTYESFFRRYDAGAPIAKIVKAVVAEMKSSLRMDDERTNVELALALALWECGALDRERAARVRAIVEEGEDLEAKRRLDADAAFLKKRAGVLAALVKKVAKPNPKPRAPRPLPKAKASPFRPGCCFSVERDGVHHGFWIASAYFGRDGGDLGIACLDLAKKKVPTLEECERAHVRGMKKGSSGAPKGSFEGDQELFEFDKREPLFAALEKCVTVIGHVAPLKSKKMLWSSSGSSYDPKKVRDKLLRLWDEAKKDRKAKRVRLGKLVKSLTAG